MGEIGHFEDLQGRNVIFKSCPVERESLCIRDHNNSIVQLKTNMRMRRYRCEMQSSAWTFLEWEIIR